MLDKIKDGFIGFVLASILVVFPYTYYQTDYFSEKPYHTLSIEGILQGPSLGIVANINKTSCEFSKLEVFGNYLGEWFLVPYRDTLDGSPSGDRVGGQHTIRITATPKLSDNLQVQDYDFFEIRTRHLCGEDDPDTTRDDRYTVDRTLGTLYRGDL